MIIYSCGWFIGLFSSVLHAGDVVELLELMRNSVRKHYPAVTGWKQIS